MRLFFSHIRLIFVNLDSRIQLILIGIIVGLCSGLAAVGLNFGLKQSFRFINQYQDKLLLFILPVLGILATVVLLKYVIRDFGGHGVPDVIHSVSMKGGALKLRSSFSKLLGSLITLASGASAGPEAPVVMSGAAIGSNIARYFRSNEMIKVAVTGSGAAAAIASIFNAPIAGIIFTMEIILGEWTSMNMLPVAIASVTGTIVSRLLNGNQIPFLHRIFQVNINDIFATVGLSLVIAVLSLAFIKFLKLSSILLNRYIKNVLGIAVSGGLLVSLIIYFYPATRGEGYELVRHVISENFSGGIFLIMGLILMKMIATSFTLSAGGSGGVFAPSLVIGSLGGLFYYQILVVFFPGSAFSGSSLFALVGMAGMISGTMQAPLTGIFLIVEITGGYDAILPLLLVAFLTSTLVKLVEKHSIYHYELVTRGILRRPRTDARILSEIKAEELLEKNLIPVHPEMLLKDIVPLIQRSERNHFPVISKKEGNFLGMVSFQDIKRYLFNPDLLNSIIVEEVMQTNLVTVSLTDNVVDILKKFDITRSWSLPAVENNRFKGLLSKSTILDHYRKELKAQTEE